MTNYHVVPREGGRWAVIKEGAMRASSTHRLKSAAKDKARDLAEKNEPAQVHIHRRDGVISDSRSYGRFSDPFPPMG